jgi:glycogen synthase
MDEEHEVGVHEARVEGVRYLLLDHHEFFDGLYWGVTAVEKIRRRVAFSRACIEVIGTFGIRPLYTFTNDAYAGLFNGLVRTDPYYRDGPTFSDTSFLHIIHNGGWQYFDTYYRWEDGLDLFRLFNLPMTAVWQFTDPHRPDCINAMATSIRLADRVYTVSPSYARQIRVRCDGLEVLLDDVVGISNAVSRDLEARMRATFDESGFLDELYPRLRSEVDRRGNLRESLVSRWPEILDGPRACEQIEDGSRRSEAERVRNKLLLQIDRGLDVDPDRPLFTMIHRITEQKGFSLLLEASEGVVGELGFQGIVGGATSAGDQIGEGLAAGLFQLMRYYPGSISFSLGYQDVSIPLLSSDVFLMPSLNEPGGISQLEAFACGCLVVARATGGLRDTVSPVKVEDGAVEGNGFLFADFTPSAFFDAMKRCAEFLRGDASLVRQARENARRSVYGWDRPACQYIESVYEMKEIIRPTLH